MAVDAVAWVKKTFKNRRTVKIAIPDGTDAKGNPKVRWENQETDQILIKDLAGRGRITISVENFAKLFGKAIKDNITNSKKAEAMAADDKGYTNFIAECKKEGLFK